MDNKKIKKLIEQAQEVHAAIRARISAKYGAREIRRAVQDILEAGLAELLLEKDLEAGDTVSARLKKNGARGANPVEFSVISGE